MTPFLPPDDHQENQIQRRKKSVDDETRFYQNARREDNENGQNLQANSCSPTPLSANPQHFQQALQIMDTIDAWRAEQDLQQHRMTKEQEVKELEAYVRHHYAAMGIEVPIETIRHAIQNRNPSNTLNISKTEKDSIIEKEQVVLLLLLICLVFGMSFVSYYVALSIHQKNLNLSLTELQTVVSEYQDLQVQAEALQEDMPASVRMSMDGIEQDWIEALDLNLVSLTSSDVVQLSLGEMSNALDEVAQLNLFLGEEVTQLRSLVEREQQRQTLADASFETSDPDLLRLSQRLHQTFIIASQLNEPDVEGMSNAVEAWEHTQRTWNTFQLLMLGLGDRVLPNDMTTFMEPISDWRNEFLRRGWTPGLETRLDRLEERLVNYETPYRLRIIDVDLAFGDTILNRDGRYYVNVEVIDEQGQPFSILWGGLDGTLYRSSRFSWPVSRTFLIDWNTTTGRQRISEHPYLGQKSAHSETPTFNYPIDGTTPLCHQCAPL